MTVRLHVNLPLQVGATLALPPGAARHVQVLRLQPGDALALFDGSGGEWRATVAKMGRSEVEVMVGEAQAADREPALHVTLALGMPANDRMDALVEKATELGVAAIQPLHCERSVLRLNAERAGKKVAHWQAVAVSASEQSGRTRVPLIAPVRGIADWLREVAVTGAAGPARRCVLSLRDARPFAAAVDAQADAAVPLFFLSGPEGGLTEAEEAAAIAAGFEAVTLGPRVLRADTAPLAALVLALR